MATSPHSASNVPSTNHRNQRSAAVPCPCSLYGMGVESASQDLFFFPSRASAALLCCPGICLVAVIMLFEVISFSSLPPFHRRIELLSMWGQRLHALNALTAGSLKATPFQSTVWKRNQAAPPTASALQSNYHLSAS